MIINAYPGFLSFHCALGDSVVIFFTLLML